MQTYLILNSTDWTPDIDVKNYAVNRAPVTEEWTDGNGRKHRDVIRQEGRISGSFQIGFKDADKIAAWENSLNMNSFHQVELYVNNISDTVETDVFLDVTAMTTRDDVNGRIWTVYQVNVEEC